jgi:hypothetical protein
VKVLRIRAQAKDTKMRRNIVGFMISPTILFPWLCLSSQLQNLWFCNSPEALSCARPKQASAQLLMNQQITENQPKTAKGRVRLYDEVLQLPLSFSWFCNYLI